MNEEKSLSGSRWEPAPIAEPWADDRSTVAVAEASPGHAVGPAGAPPRRPRARLVTATVAGAALLLIGGAGGYAIGQASAGGSGTAGPSGTFGPGPGGPGGRGGSDFGGQFGGGPGAGAGGTTPGTGTGGTGTGGAAAGTGTGST